MIQVIGVFRLIQSQPQLRPASAVCRIYPQGRQFPVFEECTKRFFPAFGYLDHVYIPPVVLLPDLVVSP